jgi:hypothetical protein
MPAAAMVAAASIFAATQALGSEARRTPRAATSGTLSVNDQAHLHVVRENGSAFVEEGPATGSLPGTVRTTLTIGLSTVRSGFTIYLHNGSITGHGTATLNAGRGEYSSFGGTLTVSHGSGHYAHASGTGRLYGTIRRTDDNATVQVVGQLHL